MEIFTHCTDVKLNVPFMLITIVQTPDLYLIFGSQVYLVEHDIGKNVIKNFRRSFSMLITMA